MMLLVQKHNYIFSIGAHGPQDLGDAAGGYNIQCSHDNAGVLHDQCLFSGLSVDISQEDMKYALEGIAGMGQVSVTYDGECRRPRWRVDWLTKPGDQPLIQVRLQLHLCFVYLYSTLY